MLQPPFLIQSIAAESYDDWLAQLINRWSEFRSASGRLSKEGAKNSAERISAKRLPNGPRTTGQNVLNVIQNDQIVFTFWLEVMGEQAFLYDVVEHVPESGLEIMMAIEGFAIDSGASELRTNVFATDALLTRLTFDTNFKVLNTQMWMLDSPSINLESKNSDLILRFMSSEEFPAFLQEQIVGYADAKVLAGSWTAAEALVKSEEEFATLVPNGQQTSGQLIFVAELQGEKVGTLWIDIDEEAEVPTAFGLHVEIDESLRGRGLGRAIMVAALKECRKRNIPGLALSVFGYNTVARTLYESFGFAAIERVLSKKLSPGLESQ